MNKEEIYIRTLTPVHIGDAKEKNLLKNIDFVSQDGRIYFLDEKKLIEHFGISTYSASLAKGDLKSLLDSVSIDEYSSHSIIITGEVGTDIMTNVSNPVSTNVYLPGSSLKGAIRSAMVGTEGMNGHGKSQKEPFGRFNTDSFRFMHTSDVHFNNRIYINSKTYTLQKPHDIIHGAWKHQSKSSIDFSSNGFTFVYECIKPNQLSPASLKLNLSQYEKAVNKKDWKGKPIVQETLTMSEALKSIENLFSIIQEYTQKYLNAEIKFFETYQNNESEDIAELLKDLLDKNNKAPVLRVGAGSGFHSITGNHLFPDDHSINGLNHKNRGTLNGAWSAKTRKLAFQKEGANIKFYPFGFVQLLSEDIHKEYLENLRNETKKIEKEEKERAIMQEALLEKKIKEKELAAIEALKPKYKSKNDFKKDFIEVDVEVLEWRQGELTLKPYIEGLDNKKLNVKYPSKVEAGTIMTLEIKLIGKKKNAFQFKGRPVLKN